MDIRNARKSLRTAEQTLELTRNRYVHASGRNDCHSRYARKSIKLHSPTALLHGNERNKFRSKYKCCKEDCKQQYRSSLNLKVTFCTRTQASSNMLYLKYDTIRKLYFFPSYDPYRRHIQPMPTWV